MAFVHLHVHSEHSPIDATNQAKPMVRKVVADGQKALAVTDHHNLGIMWKLKSACKDAGIKPIPGFEGYLAYGAREDGTVVKLPRDTIDVDATQFDDSGAKISGYMHITLLAYNRTGWHNLVRLHNRGYEQLDPVNNTKPLLDFALMSEYSEGIIALTGCLGGPVAGPLSRGRRDVAQSNLNELVRIFGRENVYVEVMYHGQHGEDRLVAALFDLARENSLPCVATSDAHYLDECDAKAHSAWLAVSSQSTLANPKFQFHGSGYDLKTEAQMRAISPSDQWQAACDMSALIADRVSDDTIPDGEMRIPTFTPPPGFATSTEFFVHLVRTGAAERFGDTLPDAIRARLNEEHLVISGRNFVDYFLMVWDVIAWARSEDDAQTWTARMTGQPLPENPTPKEPIMVGPGRGSAAGSLVSYCLDIVRLDPMKHHLLFERFLAPDRAGMPDIDVDFESRRRSEVVRYLQVRWGERHVAQIGTYMFTRTKAAIKASGRVLGEAGLAAKLSKLVPLKGVVPLPFKDFIDVPGVGDDFAAALREAGDAGEELMHIARGIESVAGAASRHACGTLITTEPIDEIVPLRRPSKKEVQNSGLDVYISQWEGPQLEEFGLLKADILGINNLDIIKHCQRQLLARGININEARIEDMTEQGGADIEAMWSMLDRGDTTGIFQLESAGMRELVTTAKPRSLTDLSTVIALYRPGPMGEGMHTLWASIKAGRAVKSYSQFTQVPAEEKILALVLDETEGVICYQEQLMRLSTVVSNFDATQRSALQKAVSKKKQSALDALREAFVAGAVTEFTLPDGTVSPSFRAETAETLWKTFQASGDYLFNKSHSAAYGIVALWMSYFKANYRAEFTAASLANTPASKTTRHKRLSTISAARQAGLQVLPPSIHSSQFSTTAVGSNIFFGLDEIKGVPSTAAHAVVAARAEAEFSSLEDAVSRILRQGESLNPANKVTVGDLANLVAAGAFDSFGPRKGLLVAGQRKLLGVLGMQGLLQVKPRTKCMMRCRA